MIEKSTIHRKLQSVERSVNRLRTKFGPSLPEFLNNQDLQDTVLHHLQIAVQGCIDIGQHIISDENWGLPASLAEIATILEQKNVINSLQAKTIMRMFAFRNVLVHDYTTVNLEKVYQVWTLGLNDIEQYLQSLRIHFSL